jgi:putative sigma-54 modulation protein
MELEILAQNIELTQRLRNYVEKKTARLDRYLPNLIAIHVELAEENTRSAVERQVAQVTIRDDRGTILRAEERSSDMFAAIDAVTDKIYRQIERYRGRRKDRVRGRSDEQAVDAMMSAPDDGEEEDELSQIVRRKQFTLYPMSPEDAIDQMELLGHDFYVFFNIEDEGINVLYRRRDGKFGLLQPELA